MDWKICGLKNEVAVRAVAATSARYAGFIFYPPSPRCLALDEFTRLRGILAPGQIPVYVNVQPALADLKQGVEAGFRHFQIHFKEAGDEAYLKALREVLEEAGAVGWLAPRVKPGQPFSEAWLPWAEGFLWDGFSPGQVGGTGVQADWSAFRRMARAHPEKQWVLAGGLGEANAVTAMAKAQPDVMDFNSLLESRPGEKDPAKIQALDRLMRAQRA